MKEKLQEYALIAEIIGGVAIVITLVFVGLQIKQGSDETALNTNALEVTAYQDLTKQLLDLNSWLAGDSIADIVYKVDSNQQEDLTPEELAKYSRVFYSVVQHGRMAYYSYKRGMIDEQTLLGMLGILRASLRNKRFNEMWNISVQNGSNEFVKYVNELPPIGFTPDQLKQTRL